MRAISINQPFASLIVKGYKKFETRKWAAYDSIIGQRIAICSSSGIRPEWRRHCKSEEFRKFYNQLDWPAIGKLPKGALVGTVIIETCLPMTEEWIASISDEERAYGDWKIGNYAWKLRDPEYFAGQQPVIGWMGFYDLEKAITDAKKKGKTTG